MTGRSKTLIDNIFYNKPMLSIIAGTITSVILNLLIQVLIELSSAVMQNLNKYVNYKDTVRNLIWKIY